MVHAEKTNLDRSVQGARNDVRLVKLQAGDWGGVTEECPVCLTCPHVPHPDPAIAASASQSIAPELHTSNKVLVHLPCAV